MIEGRLDQHVVVDALQGGAGTSTNMNVNEVLANRALQLLRLPLGDYHTRQPARRHQPPPVDQRHLSHGAADRRHPPPARIAAEGRRPDGGLPAEGEGAGRRGEDRPHRVAGRGAGTLGREMSAYAEAIARDRWRIYKCEERLRVVNLGGTAIGTGLARAAAVRLPRRRAASPDHRPGAGPGGEPRRRHAERRRLGGGQRHPPHPGRQPAEDRQRPAAALFRARTPGWARSASRRGRPAPRSCPARSIPSSPRPWPRRPWP